MPPWCTRGRFSLASFSSGHWYGSHVGYTGMHKIAKCYSDEARAKYNDFQRQEIRVHGPTLLDAKHQYLSRSRWGRGMKPMGRSVLNIRNWQFLYQRSSGQWSALPETGGYCKALLRYTAVLNGTDIRLMYGLPITIWPKLIFPILKER